MDQLAQLEEIKEEDIIQALCNIPTEDIVNSGSILTKSVEEDTKEENDSMNNINTSTSDIIISKDLNTETISTLFKQLLNDKTLEISIKIKD